MSRQRLNWAQVPWEFARAVEAALGADIIEVANIPLGFSPGPAGPCDLADGRRVFLKAAGTTLNPDTPEMLRAEAEVLAGLSPTVRAPVLIASVDDGEWVALITELLQGHSPQPPLSTADIDAILDLIEHLADVDPAHVAKSQLIALGHSRDRFDQLQWPQALNMADRLPQWVRDHLNALIEWEQSWVTATAGDHLLHMDLRADNIVAHHNTAWAVDWSSARLGAPWVDLVTLLPSLHLDGAESPAAIFADHRVGRSAPPHKVTTFLVHLTGYFLHNSLLEEPPGLTGLRAFQAAQGQIALEWLMQRRLE